MYPVYGHWNEIYLFLFLCEIHNEVHKHVQWLSELWEDHNIVITSL